MYQESRKTEMSIVSERERAFFVFFTAIMGSRVQFYHAKCQMNSVCFGSTASF